MLELPKPLNPVVLVILDGWGIAPDTSGNSINLAQKPFFNSIKVSYPHTELVASGESVGLPYGEAGNSEVGHLNIGAGKIVYQDEPRINSAIADGSFLTSGVFKNAFEHTNQNNSSLHIMGLVGTGKVHASVEHLFALVLAAKENSVKNIFLHLFTDGRDSSPTSGFQVISQIETKIETLRAGKIASVMGRYWAMDRDKRWERTQKAYRALVFGEGDKVTDSKAAIESAYQKNVTDEFIEPTLVTFEDNNLGTIKDNDSVIFFNFRPDRARELTHAFVLPNFADFDRGPQLKNLNFVTLTEYEKGLPVTVAFPHEEISQPLAKVVSDHQLKQLHIGESEKYAHVTYFINGGREDPFPMEDRVHIPSPKIKTYDLKPEMSAIEITDYVVAKLKSSSYEFYVVNFANADMVGHTGSISATTKAIETLDRCLKRIAEQVLVTGGAMVVTSDHGNAEQMLNLTTGGVDTEHSTNQVPFIVVAKDFQDSQTLQFPAGILADVAPTILALMGITKPGTMVGHDLLGVKILNKGFE